MRAQGTAISRKRAERLMREAGVQVKPQARFVRTTDSDHGLPVAAIVDLFSRRVVGWAMQERMDRSLVLAALAMAVGQRRPPRGLIHHSDRGSQYACEDYRTALTDYGMVPSMSRRACCYDNAAMESFWHTLKVELIHRHRFQTRVEATQAIFEFIEVFDLTPGNWPIDSERTPATTPDGGSREEVEVQ